MVNYRLQKLILGVVDNQIKDKSFPIVRDTFERLVKEGATKLQAKKIIGGLLVENIYNILSESKEFDEKKYARDLKTLHYDKADFKE